MRKNLKKMNEVRDVFQGEFVRHGVKNGWHGQDKTLLLKDVKNKNGVVVTDHLWFNYTKGFEALGELKEGDVIQFQARVKEYEKGYKGFREDVYKPIEIDYKLSHPTKIMKIEPDNI